MKPLVDYSKDYIQSENKLYDYPKKKVIAYVENEDDVPFWWDVFNKYAPSLKITLSPSTREKSLERGKASVLKLKDRVGDYLILCIDSDYDYLLQETTETSKLINHSPYIFQTYTYSIENYKCYADSLRGICVKATCHDEEIFDFVSFFKEYSELVYELFVYSYYFHKVGDTKSLSLSQFCGVIKILKKVDLSEQGRPAIEALKQAVAAKIADLKSVHPNLDMGVISDELKQLGVEKNNVYLFIRGHVIYENVTLRVLKPVIERLTTKKFQGFKEASASPKEDRQRKINEYQKLLYNYEILLATNTDYHSCFLMRKIRVDVEKFVERLTITPITTSPTDT